MSKITELTKEQEAKLPVYRDMYLDKFFNNQHVTTQEECEEYFEFFYKEFTDVKEKPKVILLDSPMALLIEKTRIDNEINGTNNPVTFEPVCYNASAFNSWVSFYDFFDKEVLTLEKSEIFTKYKRILDMNIFWSLTYDTHVFVSRNAIEYKRNRNFELHNVDGAAVTFRDGFKLYFINGVGIKEELFNKLLNKEYTFGDFTLEKNEEIKAAILVFFEEKWGSAYMFDFISKNLKEVDTYTNIKDEKYLEGTTKGMNIGVYTLFKGKVMNENIAFVRCFCPSTDRMFFLGVEPTHTKAKDAIASLYRIPRKLKSQIKEINRQGERYSTTFHEGTNINLPKNDIEDLVSLNGDEYFDLIKYEF